MRKQLVTKWILKIKLVTKDGIFVTNEKISYKMNTIYDLKDMIFVFEKWAKKEKLSFW